MEEKIYFIINPSPQSGKECPSSVCPSFCNTFLSAPYLLNPLNDYHLTSHKCSSQWAGVQSTWSSYLDSRSRSQDLPLNFMSAQMFLSVSWCAEAMTQLHRFKVKVTVQSHWLYPWVLCRLHISWSFWKIFRVKANPYTWIIILHTR